MECAYINSPVGWLEVVEESNTITRLRFMNEVPTDVTMAATTLLQQAVAELQAYFEGIITDFQILQHCNQPGTAFQKRVWDELVKIPYAKTASYLQMAIRLGDEKCIRAAASANGKNDLAIIVPCHRVIGSDGSLTGYAGGLWRKKWLLQHEAKFGGGTVQGSLGF